MIASSDCDTAVVTVRLDLDCDGHWNDYDGQDDLEDDLNDEDETSEDDEDSEDSSSSSDGSISRASSPTGMPNDKEKIKELTFHIHILEEKLAFAKQETGKITNSMLEQKARFDEQLKLIQSRLEDMDKDGLCESCGDSKKVKQGLAPLLETCEEEEEPDAKKATVGDEDKDEEWEAEDESGLVEGHDNQQGEDQNNVNATSTRLSAVNAEQEQELEALRRENNELKVKVGLLEEKLFKEKERVGRGAEEYIIENQSKASHNDLIDKSNQTSTNDFVIKQQDQECRAPSTQEKEVMTEEGIDHDGVEADLKQQLVVLKADIKAKDDEMCKKEEVLRTLQDKIQSQDLELKEKLEKNQKDMLEVTQSLSNRLEVKDGEMQEVKKELNRKNGEMNSLKDQVLKSEEKAKLSESKAEALIKDLEEARKALSAEVSKSNQYKAKLEEKEASLRIDSDDTDLSQENQKLKAELDSKQGMELKFLNLSTKIKSIEEHLLECSCSDAALVEKTKQILDLNSKMEMLIKASNPDSLDISNEDADNLMLELDSLKEKDFHSMAVIENLTLKIKELEADLSSKEEKLEGLKTLETSAAQKDKALADKDAAIEAQSQIIKGLELDLECGPRKENVREMLETIGSLEANLEVEKDRVKAAVKEMLACQMERDSHKRLIKELNTWARDLKETLYETEREKEREKKNFQSIYDGIRADHERQTQEMKAKIEALTNDLGHLVESNSVMTAKNRHLMRDKERLAEKSQNLRQELAKRMKAVSDLMHEAMTKAREAMVSQEGGKDNVSYLNDMESKLEAERREFEARLQEHFALENGLNVLGAIESSDEAGEEPSTPSTETKKGCSKPPIPLPVRTRVARTLSESTCNLDQATVRRLDRDLSVDRQSTTSRESNANLTSGGKMRKSRGLFGSLKKLGRSISVDRHEKDFESGSDISNASQSSKLSVSSRLSTSAKQLLQRARDISTERKKEEDSEANVSEKGQKKAKSGPFGPLGNTGTAFRRYFDKRQSSPAITPTYDPADRISPPVNRRLPMPEPD